MAVEVVHGNQVELDEFRINNYRFGVGIGGTGRFRIVALSCLKINSFSGKVIKLYIFEEYLERLYTVLKNFGRQFFEKGIPSWTKIELRQEQGTFRMGVKLDKYTKTSTKVPCEDGLRPWKITFTYEEFVAIFHELQERGILINVRDKCN